jgi:GTP cyclohydrolase II
LPNRAQAITSFKKDVASVDEQNAAYQLQDGGHDTVEANHILGFEADQGNYALCAAALTQMGISRSPADVE